MEIEFKEDIEVYFMEDKEQRAKLTIAAPPSYLVGQTLRLFSADQDPDDYKIVHVQQVLMSIGKEIPIEGVRIYVYIERVPKQNPFEYYRG